MADRVEIDMALLEADIVNARTKVLRAARRAVHFEGARHSIMTLKHAIARFDAAMHKAYEQKKAVRGED